MNASLVVTDEEALAAIVRGARRVAVIGMVDEQRADRPAYTIPEMCRESGMEVIPVNPKIESSQGLRAYPDLASVPEPFDLVDVFRRPRTWSRTPTRCSRCLRIGDPGCSGCRAGSGTTRRRRS